MPSLWEMLCKVGSFITSSKTTSQIDTAMLDFYFSYSHKYPWNGHYSIRINELYSFAKYLWILNNAKFEI